MWGCGIVRDHRRLALFLTVGLLAAHPGRAADLDLAIVLDGPAAAGGDPVESLRQQIASLVGPGVTVGLDPEAIHIGDHTPAGIESALQRALDGDVDVVITLDPGASGRVVRLGSLPRPVIAANLLPGLPTVPPAGPIGTGSGELAWLEATWTVGEAAQSLARLTTVSSLGILSHAGLVDGVDASDIPGLDPSWAVRLVALDASTDLPAALDGLDAVVVGPLGPAADRRDALAEALLRAGIPSVALAGPEDVEAGLLLGPDAPDAQTRVNRTIALYVDRLRRGGSAATWPTEVTVPVRPLLNARTAGQLGLDLGWSTLTQATLVGLGADGEATWDLRRATVRAIDHNRVLATSIAEVDADAQAIVRARSSLFPQASVGLGAGLVDADRAAGLGGSLPQFAASFTADVTQVIYDEGAYAAPRVQTLLQEARTEGLQSLRLDVGASAATAWIDLQRALTRFTVRRTNLQRTRDNLSLAEARASSGAAGPDEVYRWEAELANAEQEALAAWTQTRQAELVLARWMNLPQGERLSIPLAPTDAPDTLVGAGGLLAAMDGPTRFQQVVEQLVAFAREQAPELRQVQATLAAQDRQWKAAKRAWYAPTIGLGFGLDQGVAAAGAGSTLPPGLDRTSFAATAGLTLPIFQGLRRAADQKEAKTDLMAIETQQVAADELIELRVRTAAFSVVRSVQGVTNARRAREAAARNLEVVATSYASGVLPLIRLLDAQEATVTAELAEVDAQYVLLQDLVELQRATGVLPFTDEGSAQAFRDAVLSPSDAP